MDMLELIREEMKPYEVKAMSDMILKESAMLGARGRAIQDLAHKEEDPLKLVEYGAEVILIGKLVDALEALSEETIAEAERLNMIEK